MKKEDCRVGMKILFGRRNGEKTLAEVLRIKSENAKVRTLETRGRGKGSAAGEEWSVPYSTMTEATPQQIAQRLGKAAKTVPMQKPDPEVEVEPVEYSPFQTQEDIHILQAIGCIYANLSPENLFADGEVPQAVGLQKRAALLRKLEGLFAAFGRRVEDFEVWEWERQRRAVFNKNPV